MVKIFGTVRDPDWNYQTVEIERDVYDDEAYQAVKALTPEGWTFLHVRVDR